MDSTYNNSTVICLQQIYIEGEKTTISHEEESKLIKELEFIAKMVPILT